MKRKSNEIGFNEVQTLRNIWENQKQLMALPETWVKAIEVLIERVFNPTKKRSSLLQLIKKMPLANDFMEEHLRVLETNGFIVVIKSGSENRVSVTPEGIMILGKNELKNTSDEILKETAYQHYRTLCFHKIERLRKKEELKPKHIAVLLFFLLNNSVGKERSYKVNSYEDLSHLEQIVSSYISDKRFEASEDFYSLKYYLVEAKRILGDVAFNKKPDYYLKEETLDYLIESLRKKVLHDNSFRKRWERFKKTYKENITFLRTRSNSYYTTSWEIELERKLLKDALNA